MRNDTVVRLLLLSVQASRGATKTADNPAVHAFCNVPHPCMLGAGTPTRACRCSNVCWLFQHQVKSCKSSGSDNNTGPVDCRHSRQQKAKHSQATATATQQTTSYVYFWRRQPGFTEHRKHLTPSKATSTAAYGCTVSPVHLVAPTTKQQHQAGREAARTPPSPVLLAEHAEITTTTMPTRLLSQANHWWPVRQTACAGSMSWLSCACDVD